MARIANHNPDHAIFFRGQNRDYSLESGSTSVYPTIFRSPGRSLSEQELEKRYAMLERCSELLVSALQERKTDGITKLKKFPELQWSILQHYEVCGTPLIDLTHSLRVAASFALDGAKSHGYVLAFGLPHPQGTITYSTEDELLNVRLLSASPFAALRPHFQEGYLVGTFPSRPDKKHPSLDLASRLIAKIEIPTEKFWDENFHAIPKSALSPDDDEIESICKELADLPLGE